MKKEIKLSQKLDYKAENDKLRAKLEIRDTSIQYLTNCLVEIGKLIDIDIQRDFDGVFGEAFIDEVCNCIEDQLAVDEYNLERQDKIIKSQEDVIEAHEKIIHNSNLIITILTQQLVTKYNDELGKMYLKARAK
ncbi:hypothetical protein [Bacillus paranthracis]|uniref:hypothetical protein n=1 Tax=Bacillus paranthracis TaxID=2026186 RepID=UPI00077822DB|nr:hypothetical protein [Bacillus paranthracis]KXY07459.1 hypothetical protein AT271_06505 [Bacillus cereus]MCC2437297.1 hypothetical protein [Bacillus paranthracis]MDG1605772.1 hypothetical protein [Bacillus paranthracis]